MQTMKAEILRHLIMQVGEKVITEKLPLDEWDSHAGIHYPVGRYTEDGRGHCVMHMNDRWEAGYDVTRWFNARAEIPESMDGKKLYFYGSFGGESLVRINGRVAGALSSENNWNERDVIFLDSNRAGDVLDIEVEATVDCGCFCEKAMLGQNLVTYTLGYAYIAAVDEETEAYWYDVKTACDSLAEIDDEFIGGRVFRAIDESLHALDFDFDDEAFYKSVPAARRIFRSMMDETDGSKQGKVHMIGHSHLDVAWLWTTRELVRKTARTFSNNLALMKKYPEFKFTQSQAIVYDYMKKYYPDIFEEVKRAVKNGQWEIVGNTWVEADTNLASGESLVRQLLYGREFFLKEFGVSSDIYWLPDCFGFTWAMPQIIKRSGMKYFNTAKLYYNAYHKFPYSTFNWRSHSGDEIIANVQQCHYEGEYDPKYLKNCWKASSQKEITLKSIGSFGYGDGGGGVTKGQAERSLRLKNMPGIPAAENTFVRDFFDGMEELRGELPTFNDELYFENHRGTFTSQAFIKKNNRRGEFLFRNAEFVNVLASRIFGESYPAEKMEEGWKILLLNQFHDILPGTSIHEAVEMTREEYAEMNKLGSGLLSNALKTLNEKITAESDGVVVWNMNSMPVSGEVEAELADGSKARFIAHDVPAMGYRVYGSDELAPGGEKVTAEKNLLENAKLRVVLDENGLIDSIFDKVNGREVLTGKGNLLTVFHDKPVHESAWNLELDYQKRFWNLDKADSIEVLEADEIKGVVRIVRTFNKSTVTQDIILAADADYVDFDTKVDWHETEKVLKAAFPVSVMNTNASYEIAHGSIDRPTHWNYGTDLVRFEVCGHKWADLSESDYGVSIINDCKYGYDIHDSLMRITLMRAPICPDPVGDKGVSTFVYRVYPHSGTWAQADTVKNAFSLNQPLKAFACRARQGTLESEKSFVQVSRSNIIIDAVKPAQDGRGVIVRMYEAERKRGGVSVKFNFGNVKSVVECNLMETDETELAVQDNEFRFFITPHQVRTFRVLFE